MACDEHFITVMGQHPSPCGGTTNLGGGTLTSGGVTIDRGGGTPFRLNLTTGQLAEPAASCKQPILFTSHYSLLMKNAILACLCISLCDDFDFPLFSTIVTRPIFVDVGLRIHI